MVFLDKRGTIRRRPGSERDATARELHWRMKSLQLGASSLPSIRCCSRSPRPASTGGEGQLSVMQIGEGTRARGYISGL